MILVDNKNFSITWLEKQQHSSTKPKSTFYPDFKICLATEGSAVWNIDNDFYSIQPGDIIFLYSGQKRTLSSFGPDGFKLCIFLFQRNAFLNPYHFLFFINCIKEKKHVIKNSRFAPFLAEVCAEQKANSPFFHEFASAKFTEFFIRLEREMNYIPPTALTIDYQMLTLMDFIDNHISNHISLKSVAEKAGLTESSFSRRFSKMNGISYKQYVISKKIDRAIFLLKTTNMKIVDIALDCGFDSVSGFYDAFKRKTGTTPNEFTSFEI